MSESRLIVAPAPFYHTGNTTRSIMLDFIIALIPAALVGYLRFGPRVAAVIAVCVGTAVLAEFLAQKATNRPITIGNLHAVYMGFVFAMLMPPAVPLWAPVVGVAFAGHGAANALVRAAESPLEAVFRYGAGFVAHVSSGDLFLGRVAGAIGVCSAAVLAGGLYLLARRRFCVCVPASFLIGVYAFAALAAALGWGEANRVVAPMFHVLAGGTMLGAFFLATEFSSAPVTTAGKIIFGFGAGVMVMLIRIYGLYPDGVPFAILFMNLWTPILDRIRPKVFGVVKEVRVRA